MTLRSRRQKGMPPRGRSRSVRARGSGIRYTMISAVTVCLLLLLGGCAGGGGVGAGCAGYADNPHISEPSHTIVAKSRTYCEGVSVVTISMHLQRKQGNTWLNVQSQTETIHNPQTNAKNVRQVVTRCVNGSYRHEVVASLIIGTNDSPIPIQSEVDHSQEVSIHC